MHPDLSHGFRVGQWKIEPLKNAITGRGDRPHHLQPKDPRVTALRVEVGEDLQRQAARIRNMLAEHDIDELLAPLMASSE